MARVPAPLRDHPPAAPKLFSEPKTGENVCGHAVARNALSKNESDAACPHCGIGVAAEYINRYMLALLPCGSDWCGGL